MAELKYIKGANEFIARLRKRKEEAKKHDGVSVFVGFTQEYAIYVHEDPNAQHIVGNYKYLENPARQLTKTYGDIIVRAMVNGATLEQGLVLAGLRLQREAQLQVPVDTSALKASAFTAKEDELETKSAIAYLKGKRKYDSVMASREEKARKDELRLSAKKQAEGARARKKAAKGRRKAAKASGAYYKYRNKRGKPKK